MGELSTQPPDDDDGAAFPPSEAGPWEPADHRDGSHGPDGNDVYDLYRRGMDLLRGRNPAAATQVLSRAAAMEPHSRSLLEALARAQFDARMYDDARQSFGQLVEDNP